MDGDVDENGRRNGTRPFSVTNTPAPLLPLALAAATGVLIEDLFCGVSIVIYAVISAVCWLCATKFRSPRLVKCSALCLGIFAALHHWRDCLSINRPPLGIAIASEPETMTLTGHVITPPTEAPRFRNHPRSQFLIQLAAPSSPSILNPRTTLLALWTGPPPHCGDLVKLRASVRLIQPARNPGQLDASSLFRRQQIWMQAEVHDPFDAVIEKRGHAPSWEQLSQWSSLLFSNQLQRGIEERPQIHALITSMILGMSVNALRETKEAFRNTGTLHLFAVSGLNLSMLAGILGQILKFIPISKRLGTLVILPTLLFYGIATGFGPSCVRALVMAILTLGIYWMNRPAVILNSLGAAALFLISWNTNNLFHVGFQLSFWLVLALLIWTTPLCRWIEKPILPDPLLPKKLWSPLQNQSATCVRPFSSAIAVTFVAWLASIPWNLFCFAQISPIGLLANLVAVPIAFANMALGFSAVLCAPLGTTTAILNRINASCAEALLQFIHWSNRLPGAHFNIRPPFLKKPSFVAFDLNGATCVLLTSGNSNCLLDCGSRSQGESLIAPALRTLGINSIDSVILCRGSSDSIGGALPLIERFHPSQIFDSPLKSRSRIRRETHDWLNGIASPVCPLAAGDSVALGKDTRMEVLFPPRDLSASIADDKSMVIRWETPAFSLLYTASAGFPTEQWLLQHTQSSKLKADVWIRGWHAREETGSFGFLKEVHPRFVISAQPPSRSLRNLQFSQPPKLLHETVFLDQKKTGAVFGEVHGKVLKLRSQIEIRVDRNATPTPQSTLPAEQEEPLPCRDE